MSKQEEEAPKSLSPAAIDQCINALKHLVSNTDEIYFLSQDKRKELMMVAGQLSRPKEEADRRLKRREEGCKRKF